MSVIYPATKKRERYFTVLLLPSGGRLKFTEAIFQEEAAYRAVGCVLWAARLGVRKIHKSELFFKRESCLPPQIHHVATTSMRVFPG